MININYNSLCPFCHKTTMSYESYFDSFYCHDCTLSNNLDSLQLYYSHNIANTTLSIISLSYSINNIHISLNIDFYDNTATFTSKVTQCKIENFQDFNSIQELLCICNTLSLFS